MAKKNQGPFWTTLPGIATAVTAFIVALTGMITTIHSLFPSPLPTPTIVASVSTATTIPTSGTQVGSVPAGLPPGEYVLTVQIWDIESDAKSQVVASQTFIGSTGSGVPDTIIQPAGHWVTAEIAKRSNLDAPSIQGHLHVPADLTREKLDIRMTPPDPNQASHIYFYVVGPDAKLRTEVRDQALATIGKDFYLEIIRPGYEMYDILIPWNVVTDTNFTLNPRTVPIGIEDFTGPRNPIAIWLSDYLTINPRFQVTNPNRLVTLQKEIEKSKAVPVPINVQAALRTSLGLDYIVSGDYEIH